MRRVGWPTANTVSFSQPLQAVIAAVQAAGFTGLEIWARDLEGFPGGAPEARRLIDGAGLTISAVQLLRDYEGCPEDEMAGRLEEAARLMDLTVALGGDTILLCANTRPDSSSDRSRQCRDLRKLAEAARQAGVRVGYEPLVWSQWVNRYEDAWKVVEAVDHPSFGLVVDTFHLFYQGTPTSFLERVPIEKCFVVQLCDARPMPLPAIDIARGHRLFPGEGVWPIGDVVRHLDQRGYAGSYNLEVFNLAYRLDPPAQTAQRAFDAFQRLREGAAA